MSFSLKSDFCLGLENAEKFEDSFGPTSVFLSFIMILRSLPRLIKSEPPKHSVLASVFQEAPGASVVQPEIGTTGFYSTYYTIRGFYHSFEISSQPPSILDPCLLLALVPTQHRTM